MTFTIDLQHKLMPDVRLSMFGIEAETSIDASEIAINAMDKPQYWQVIGTDRTA